MCGISGYIGESKKPILTFQLITKLFEKSESRGTDAAGFWGTKSGAIGNVLYHKEPGKSSNFVKKDIWKDVSQHNPNLLLVHARGASKGLGEPFDNQNNHPFTSLNKSIGLVHNGRIDDCEYDNLKQKYEPHSKCDSELLLRIFEAGELHPQAELETFGSIEAPERLAGVRDIYSLINEGHMAVAIGERAADGNRLLWLFRNEHRPLWVVDMRESLGQVFFVSEPQIWEDAVRECSGVKSIVRSQKLIELPTEEIWFFKITESKPVPENVQRFEVLKGATTPWQFDGIKCVSSKKDSNFEVITNLDDHDKIIVKNTQLKAEPILSRTYDSYDLPTPDLKAICEEIVVSVKDIQAEVEWQTDEQTITRTQLDSLLMNLDRHAQEIEQIRLSLQ